MAETTPKPTVGIQTGSPNEMYRDLGLKFAADMRSLVTRSVSIMVPAIGKAATVDIVLSVLAGNGLQVETAAGCPARTFEAIVDAATESRRSDEP